MSIAAMVVSAVTTYLSFFYEHYTLTANIAHVATSVQTSSFSSGEGKREVNYRVFFKPTLVLSNRGSRPLVLTDIRLVRSQSIDTCAKSGDKKDLVAEFKPTIVEPGTVRDLAFEFGRGTMTDDFETRNELWCLQVVIFDHRGNRSEPLAEAVRAKFQLVEKASDKKQDYPELKVEVDYPRQPMTLAASGWLSWF